MAEPLASAADVAQIWQPLTPEQQSRASGLAEYASAMLRQMLPGIDGWIADGTVGEPLVRFTVANAIKRVLANPDSVLQESIDDYSSTKAAAAAAGEILFTADDLAALRPLGGRGAARAFTIRPGVVAR